MKKFSLIILLLLCALRSQTATNYVRLAQRVGITDRITSVSPCTTYTAPAAPAAAATPIAFVESGSGAYVFDEGAYNYRVWAYKQVGAVRIFSTTYQDINGTEPAGEAAGYVQLAWQASTGATGYRVGVIVDHDNSIISSTEYYFDVTVTGADIGLDTVGDIYVNSTYATTPSTTCQ